MRISYFSEGIRFKEFKNFPNLEFREIFFQYLKVFLEGYNSLRVLLKLYIVRKDKLQFRLNGPNYL